MIGWQQHDDRCKSRAANGQQKMLAAFLGGDLLFLFLEFLEFWKKKKEKRKKNGMPAAKNGTWKIKRIISKL